ncbi:CRISPR-associated protein Csx11 [bacterium]|nr:CRISPR-associated protein Csx11 [bacterium]MBU1957917.1 CRISPR-associated protein Csx11 [bacterium]
MNVNDLTDNKDEILKAEIGSLLFLIEKTFLSWWKKNGYFSCETALYENQNQEIKSILETTFQNIKIDVSKLMTNYTQNQNEINLWQHFFKDWRKWRGNNPHQITSQLKILQKLYGASEGLNSGIEKGSPKEQIIGDYSWLSNSFGSFKSTANPNLFDEARNLYTNDITILLNRLSTTDFNFYSDRKKILSIIENLYKNLPSDTRFPLNDTTLWDQAYMATSMFKALLAGVYLQPINTNNYDLSKINWSILAIQYDKLSLAEKGLKPAHIQTYRKMTKIIDLKLKNLIENKYALGNEVYRDETGIYFLVSENLKGVENGDFYELHTDLDEIKNKILDIFHTTTNDEFYPAILLSKPTRATMNLTTFLEKAKENFLKADYSKKENPNEIEDAIGICQVCQSRFATKTNDDIPMCEICQNRKQGRVEKWLNKQDGETIWIGELADKNNRVAMVTLKFELIEWLNGSLLSSLLGQQLDLTQLRYQDYVNDIYAVLKDAKELNDTLYIKNYSENIPVNQPLRKVVETWFIERAIGTIYENFLKDGVNNKINFQNRIIEWDTLTDDEFNFLSKIVLQFLLRKNPSPARLRRVWESTEGFFDEVKNDVLGSIQTIRTKKGFVQKVPDFANLESQIKEEFYKQYFSIIDPTPISWQFIIPTEKLECTIDKIQKLYYQNFKYVNGKLPLHIGVVVQNYKKPLYVGIKALRNIRRDVKNWSEISTNEKLKELSSYFDVKESNNNSQDFYSLYETDNQEYDFSLLPSSKGIKKYNTTDNFTIYLNTIDFEFLDTNSRRNDIFYKSGKRTIELKSNRPYSWQEWEQFKRFKEQFANKSNQLQTLVSLIYSKMEDWKDEEDSFERFIKTTFKKENIELLQFGINDCSFKEITKFLDMFAYYHTTLKEI